MLAITLATLLSQAPSVPTHTPNQRAFAAAVLAGAACRHVILGISFETVTDVAMETFKDFNINTQIVKDPEVQRRAREIYNIIKTRRCLP